MPCRSTLTLCSWARSRRTALDLDCKGADSRLGKSAESQGAATTGAAAGQSAVVARAEQRVHLAAHETMHQRSSPLPKRIALTLTSPIFLGVTNSPTKSASLREECMWMLMFFTWMFSARSVLRR